MGQLQVMDFLGSAAFSKAVQALDIKTGMLVCLKIVKVICLADVIVVVDAIIIPEHDCGSEAGNHIYRCSFGRRDRLCWTDCVRATVFDCQHSAYHKGVYAAMFNQRTDPLADVCAE